MRKEALTTEQIYHVINRSIAKYEIFNDEQDYLRIMEIIDLYQFTDFVYKYSNYLRLSTLNQTILTDNIKKSSLVLVEIIAYCIMPTHIHLVFKQVEDNGISKYMARLLNSYSRYFNIRHQRKGPLWEGRFKNVLVTTDEQLIHLTRYIHLNPVSAGLVLKPEEWMYSSYLEYIEKIPNRLCNTDKIIEINPKDYQKFVHDRIAYQKELSKIKYLLLDGYTG